jgi:hypothetical protein
MRMQSYFSKIYWHFTGGPAVDWENITEPREIKNKTKSPDESVEILNEIIASQKLIASCTEKIMGELTTRKFCCVCDIPFKDLIGHAEYYGRVAIGFAARSIHRQFNPVLYLERDFPAPDHIIIDDKLLPEAVQRNGGRCSLYDYMSYLLGLDSNARHRDFLNQYFGHLTQCIKFTRFSENDDETFYREREWRSINGDYHFVPEDVEAIIGPREFIPAVKEQLSNCQYKNDIAIIPFDFLEKV